METLISSFKFYFFYLQAKYAGFPYTVRIAAFIVVLLAITYFFTLYQFILSMYRIKRERLRKNDISKKYKEKLKSILFASENYSGENIKNQLNTENTSFKKWEKEKITDLILDLKMEKNPIPLNEKNYSRVLDAFSLVSYWEGYLRTRNLKKNKEALRQLDSLGKIIPSSSLAYRIEERNHDLRKHVKSGFIHYASYDNFKFLEDDFDSDFNPLDELRIHVALKERAKQSHLPLLIRWVQSAKNESYKCFLIGEIGLFKQKESAPQLLEMYKETTSDRIRTEIVKTLGALKYVEAQDILASDYGSSPEMLQSKIIDTMGQFGTPEALRFLVKIYGQASNTDLYIKIVHNIYKVDEQKDIFRSLKEHTTSTFQKSVFDQAEQTLARTTPPTTNTNYLAAKSPSM